MAEEEYDYDDPRFLESLSAASSTKELTYAEKRKRDIQRGFDKGRTHAKSRKQEEEERREEGLTTNLIARDTELGESKALRMMKGMGFKPGEALGKKRPAPEDDDGNDSDGFNLLGGQSGHRGIGSGIGSSSRTASGSGTRESSPKPRTEPISFQMRDRRTGLGVPSTTAPKARVLSPSELASLQASTPLPDVNLYLERNRGSFDDRKAQGLLRSVRKTLEELDRRNGIEESVMWKAPEDAFVEERKKRARRAFRGGDADPDEEFGVDVWGERKDLDERMGKGALGYEKGESKFVVDVDGDDEDLEKSKEDEESQALALLIEQDRAEEEEWLSFDPRVRLALTLAYLRKTYFYCVWCGCKYTDAEDMTADCPGEDEKDHE